MANKTSKKPAKVVKNAAAKRAAKSLAIHEDDHLDEARFAAWVKEARELPGERM